MQYPYTCVLGWEIAMAVALLVLRQSSVFKWWYPNRREIVEVLGLVSFCKTCIGNPFHFKAIILPVSWLLKWLLGHEIIAHRIQAAANCSGGRQTARQGNASLFAFILHPPISVSESISEDRMCRTRATKMTLDNLESIWNRQASEQSIMRTQRLIHTIYFKFSYRKPLEDSGRRCLWYTRI